MTWREQVWTDLCLKLGILQMNRAVKKFPADSENALFIVI